MSKNSDEKIIALFRKGWSIDLISELGLTYGWTREDAKRIVEDRHWSLDWSGRLSSSDLHAEQFGNLPYRNESATVGIEKMIEEAMEHELLTIRQQARKAHDAVERLRHMLAERVRRDAEQAAREALQRQERARELADPRRAFEHGTWGGYLTHRRNGIPVCTDCEMAANMYRETYSGPQSPCERPGDKITA